MLRYNFRLAALSRRAKLWRYVLVTKLFREGGSANDNRLTWAQFKESHDLRVFIIRLEKGLGGNGT